MEAWSFGVVAGLLASGLAAGALGGALGVGGSVLMIPAMRWLLGDEQHLYQAAAMLANVAVAVPATLRHARAGTIDPRVIRTLLPVALAAVLLGVWLSNRPLFRDGGSVVLSRCFAGFLLYVIGVNVYRLTVGRRAPAGPERITAPRIGGVGAAMGTVAGLLGIGGGAIAVPLQQVTMRIPLRACIAHSAAAMGVSALAGACYKNATLWIHGHSVGESLALAALLGPACALAAPVGAAWTHRLPTAWLRVALIGVLAASAWKMAV